jgi:hypothetical protein
MLRCLRFAVAIGLTVFLSLVARAALQSGEVHVWETQEVTFEAAHDYPNPYADVVCWIELSGPGFQRRVYGFWDGGRMFKVRFVATAPGDWRWEAGSNQPTDTGLSGKGQVRAVAWSDAEIQENPNRRGFVRANRNGHALVYADGSPFFLVGDTWLAASTWRLPFGGGVSATKDYTPGSGISFEQAVAWRKAQGFNSISFIAAFPNWDADSHGATFANKDGVFLRNAWEKFGHWAPNAKISTADGATTTAKDMGDEHGNRPFALFADREGLADFDRINPAYFRSLDRKMQWLAEEGFVPMLEPVRRDHGPSWKAYFDFNRSYGRFIEYLIARYGSYNLIFSGIHLDWIPKDYSLTASEFNAALTQCWQTYGGLPFGQPCTTLIDYSTYKAFGHAAQCPWLTMHSIGNKPRDHSIYAALEEIFRLTPAYPAANMEPYYTGWNHAINRPAGETPEAGSDRDVYFARAMMYGSVLSGGLAGHVHGTAAYDMTSTGEPEGWRPYFWRALRYRSGAQMQWLRDFVLSSGPRYQDLTLASDDLLPRSAPKAPADGLDGWCYLMRTAEKDLALAYFENGAPTTRARGFEPGARYQWAWYDPRAGSWAGSVILTAGADGTLEAPPFPKTGANIDWAAKITRRG